VVQPYKTATQSGVTQIAFTLKANAGNRCWRLREIVQDGICGYVVKPKPELIADAIIDFFDNDRKDKFTDGVKQERRNFPGIR